MDRYFKHYGYIKLLDWEQFLQHPIYIGAYFIRICRCCERELEQSQHPIPVHRLLQFPDMGSASFEASAPEGQGAIMGNSRAVLLPSCFELSRSARGLAEAVWGWHPPIERQLKGVQRAYHTHVKLSVCHSFSNTTAAFHPPKNPHSSLPEHKTPPPRFPIWGEH